MAREKAYREKMKKSITGRYLNKSWFVILASFIISLLLLYSYHTRVMIENNNFFILEKSPLNPVIGTDRVQQKGGLENEEIPINESNSLETTEIIHAENEAHFIKIPRLEEPVKKSSLSKRRNRKVKSHQNLDHRILVIAERVNRENEAEMVPKTDTKIDTDTDIDIDTDTDDSCIGKRIFMHRIPRKFNEDLIKHCDSLSTWTDMCKFVSNSGLGPRLANQENVFSNTGWFATNQFSLEVIFHNRMKQYKCLTKNSSLANAFFVPFYAGLDVAQYLWGCNLTMRDNAPREMMKWLRAKSEWKVMDGRDHFMVAGRISWDFRRSGKKDSDWGNNLMILPESKNMTILSIESSPWNHNGLAIPYPTYFHPSNDVEIWQWQRRMRRLERPFLYSFAGAPRPNLRDSIRNEIIDQCKLSMTKCNLLECNDKDNNCHKPVNVMQMFQSSIFCLQPPGDSFTRRSAFDSILAGCIPVFFHPGSAYVQYIWHLPKDYTTYSVFIPMNEVKSKEMSIERVLSNFSKRKVMEMREEVIRLIPKMVYADPRFRLERNGDAFDLAVKGVLERVKKIRRYPNEGFDVPEKASWKYNLFGIVGDHEWDPFFANQGNYGLDNIR